MGGGYQNGEAYSSLPVGTKLQGHIDSIKGSFGFIRSDSRIPLYPNIQPGASSYSQAGPCKPYAG